MSTQETGNAGEGRRAGNVIDESVFRFLLDLELQKAVRLQYCVSVILVSLDEGNGAGNGHAGEPGEAVLTRQIAESVAPHLRSTDVVAPLPGRALGVLLIDAETGNLPAILGRATDEWRARPVAPAGRERPLKWSAGGGCFPLTATNATGLMRQATDLMTRARAEGGDRLYLPT